MSEPFLAEIRLFPFNFAPVGWAFCSGQILSISQNTALFSLLGTNFGGNGTTNFALPNLQGVVPVCAGEGAGSGLADYVVGQTGGVSTVTLSLGEMAGHAHLLTAFVGRGAAATGAPTSGSVLTASEGGPLYASTSSANTLDQSTVLPAGGGMPHNNLMPYLGLNFCIALQGIFPSRN